MAIAVVQLGRNGDIINILPIVKHLYDEGKNPTLVVQEAYAGILDGISYAKPFVYKGIWTDPLYVAGRLKDKFERVLVPQVYGKGISHQRLCDSFTQESWRVIGYLNKWDTLPPLLFDRRSPNREIKLVADHLPRYRKSILVATAGHSSPFPYVEMLMNSLRDKWGDSCEIVDLSKITAHRIYDMLWLLDNSSLLISIDSAIMHLSCASAVPLIQLITDKPSAWHGSVIRRPSALTLRYNEVPGQLDKIHDVISQIVNKTIDFRMASA